MVFLKETFDLFFVVKGIRGKKGKFETHETFVSTIHILFM